MALRKLFVMLFFLGGGRVASAAPMDPTAEEVEHLLASVKNSGCDFNRNGRWYSSQQAAAHLKKKYDYALKNNQLSSAETFITELASRSSLTQKPYQIRCPQQPIVDSNVWFQDELLRYRNKK